MEIAGTLQGNGAQVYPDGPPNEWHGIPWKATVQLVASKLQIESPRCLGSSEQLRFPIKTNMAVRHYLHGGRIVGVNGHGAGCNGPEQYKGQKEHPNMLRHGSAPQTQLQKPINSFHIKYRIIMATIVKAMKQS